MPEAVAEHDVVVGLSELLDVAVGLSQQTRGCGVGDPACDLAIAWTMLSGPSRKAFRDTLSVSPETWARGRGWALWKALAGYAGAVRSGDSEPADVRHTLDEILTEYQQSS
ncbi:hypothetical protein SAMN05421678_117100 [Actinopolymorpha cephalotaxi]|uniref:Aminoglycoside phosphotransferase (APT) family kinase protein n=1 Tax=Actinopolymorpha cephalotaxi TaxID=504797 RepID=A0A1I2ZWY6_9ACTN|nr:hypothetical protein [Actinopolymorpha cephalotaxi]NYH84200.1 aminoglycoside phosphotransferase (APT) family kinase protein [Actinopolymorpha cephalotaxi]SFH41999.1 hypothetical protein SAMN05421678_117100 [Actinopolymorpha cephalotaxi]